jgi:isoquinoline 1-oxidoreductase beta subunit
MNAPFDLTKAVAMDAASPETPLVIANISRRKFLQGASALGGLVLAVGFPASSRAADPPKYGADGMPQVGRQSARVRGIGQTHRQHRLPSPEMPGVRTGMPMIVADEAEAVRRASAGARRQECYGNQDTDGSRSTHFFMPMRRCGAAARQMLEAAAAARWNVPIGEVQAKNGEVVHTATGRRLGYGALAQAAAKMPLPAMDKIKLKDPSQFRYIGTGKLKLVDAPDIATGKAQYGTDTRLPGMVYAVVARPQVYGGKVVSVDSAAALKVPGVLRVVQIDPTPGAPQFNPLGGVAVIGRNTWAALQGRAALKIVWDDGPNATYDSAAYRTTLEEAARKPGKVVRNDGDFTAAAAAAAKRVTAEYYLPHLAHASMEAPAASARIVNGKCEVWGCFQSPQAARDLVAKRLGMPVENVTVHVTLLNWRFRAQVKPDTASRQRCWRRRWMASR